MSRIFAINFAAGFETTVKDILNKLNLRLILLEDGFCIIKSSGNFDVAKLKFGSTVYEVLSYGEDLSKFLNNLEDDLSVDVLGLGNHIFPDGHNSRTFNLRYFEVGCPIKMDSDARLKLLALIAEKTRLGYSAFNPDEDFVLLLRKSGVFIFGIKLKVLNKTSNKKVRAGALRSDFAYLLCEFLSLRSGAKVPECFAGYGGISEIILENFNPAKFRLVEKESGLVNELKLKFKECQNCKVVSGEAVKYLRKNNEEFDFIIADPPWGEYDSTVKIAELYADFLEAAKLRLSSDGKILIFSSAKDVLESAVKKLGLKIEKRADVLISGKKVLVFSLC